MEPVLTCRPLWISSHGSLKSVFSQMANMCIKCYRNAMLLKWSLNVSVHKQNRLLLLKWKHEIYVCESVSTNLNVFEGSQFLFNSMVSQCPDHVFSQTLQTLQFATLKSYIIPTLFKHMYFFAQVIQACPLEALILFNLKMTSVRTFNIFDMNAISCRHHLETVAFKKLKR